MDEETTKTEEETVESPETQAPESAVSSEELKIAEAAIALLPDDDESEEAITGLQKKADQLVGEITATRAVVRQLKSQATQIDAENEAKRSAAPAVPVKSPMDIFVEEHPNEIPSGEVHQAERDFQASRQEQTAKVMADGNATKATKARVQAAIDRGVSKYSDFYEITETAEELLTKGDIVDIKDSKKPEDMLYKRSIQRIIESGGESAKELAKRLKSKKGKVESKSVQKKAPKEEDGSTRTAPKDRNVRVARLHNVLG